MNERIKQLAQQATDIVETFNPDTGITHHREFFNQEKFAELILKECLSYMKDGDIDFVKFMIKRNFGVEQ
jgi:hypothetical protein